MYLKRRREEEWTVTIGITGNTAMGAVGYFNLGLTIDAQQNIAVQTTVNAGGGTPNFSPFNVYVAITSAPTYKELEGLGTQVGGSVSTLVLSVGGEYLVLPNNKVKKGYYEGISASFSKG